ncbi:MAG: SLC13 family permease [Chloroflexota bacterium]|nr:SLC13 family permease [Chloroflexota bacterium]
MPITSAVAAAIFIGTLVLLLVRPRRVPDWSAALGGGALLVVLGVLPVGDALGELAASWNVFLFFLGLGLSAATADRAGVFRAAAEAAARLGGGSQPRLLINLYAAGVLVTAVLSNDATALLLTPVAFAVATRLGLDPRPYAFACALVANAASFLLPVSNPANLLVLSRAPLSLVGFLMRLLLPSLLAIALTLVGLLVIFRAELAAPFSVSSGTSQRLERRTVVGLVGAGALTVLYVVGSALSWPLGVVAVCGALFLVMLDGFAAGWQVRALLREVPWTLFPLLAGLLLLVNGAERIGLVAPLVHMVEASARLGLTGLPLAALGMAVLANVLNNLPAALVAASALAGLAPGIERSDLAAAVIVGVNLGPNLTTIGSLATMLWLVLMRRHGVEVSALTYFRVGAVATVPALLAAAAGLWIAARLIGGV